MIYGAAALVSARPAAVREAISGATLAVGVDAYQAAFARGRAMTNEELEVLIDAEVAYIRGAAEGSP